MPRISSKPSVARHLIKPKVSDGDRYCDTCDKEFSRPSELKRHLRDTLIHNKNARKFICIDCGSRLTQKSNLKIHERTHLNEKKEVCYLPLDEDCSRFCDFKCSDPSSMTRHIYTAHTSPFNYLGTVPLWLTRAMTKRQEKKGYSVEPALAPTPPLSSSRRSSTPRSAIESGLCTPSMPPAEPPAGYIKTNFYQTNPMPRASIDITGGDRALPQPATLPLLPTTYQPVPYYASAAPDLTFNYHQYAAPAPAFPVYYNEGLSASTSAALPQLIGQPSYYDTIQGYNPGFQIPYIAQVGETLTQDVDNLGFELFNQFGTNYFA